MHLLEAHAILAKCKLCENTFEKNSDLEIHLKTHSEVEHFKCNKCEKVCYLEWRLKKHLEAHDQNVENFCYFYNNEEFCPYEEVGCMFLHANSPQCIFQNNCRKEFVDSNMTIKTTQWLKKKRQI